MSLIKTFLIELFQERYIVEKRTKVRATVPKVNVNVFKPRLLDFGISGKSVQRRHRGFDIFVYLFIWLIKIHWLTNTQITFWYCCVHFCYFFIINVNFFSGSLSLNIKPIERFTQRLKRVNLMANISVSQDWPEAK